MRKTTNPSLSRFILFSFLLAAQLSARTVFSDDDVSERGRLPDGRAFRTDVHGNEIVDYIAELEVSIEQLNRRIYGLEEEVRARDAMLAGASSHLQESEIGEKPVTAQPPISPQIASPLVAECVRSLDEVRGNIDSKNAEISLLNASVSALSKRNDELSRELATIKSMQRVHARSPASSGDKAPDERASLSYQRAVVLKTTRARVLAEINEVQELVRQRDEMFRKAFQQSGSLRVAPSPAVSSRGTSLADLKTLVGTSEHLDDFTKIRRELQTISKRIREDVALVSRFRSGTVSPTSRSRRADTRLQ